MSDSGSGADAGDEPRRFAFGRNWVAFLERVENEGLNGIVGGLENYDAVEGADLMERILEVSRTDLDILFSAR